MATVSRFRPHRVNMDGMSKTETRKMGVALLPGTIVRIATATNTFTNVGVDGAVRRYILNCDTIQGLGITDPVAVGESGVGDYFEEGRAFAAQVLASSVLIKDTPLWLTSAGVLTTVAVADVAPVAFADEIFTAPATPATSPAIVRVA